MKIGDLTEGMHAGVRSSRTDHTDLLARHPADAFFQNLLDGKAVDLTLPSAIGAAIILDDQL